MAGEKHIRPLRRSTKFEEEPPLDNIAALVEYFRRLAEARPLCPLYEDDDEEAIRRLCDFIRWVKSGKGKKPPPKHN